jgi:DNA mismatch repair protein MutL
LEELAEKLLSGRGKPIIERTRTLLHAVACHAALKAGKSSRPEELQALAEQVLADPELRRCPHGRPLVLSLGKDELYKRFSR